MLTETHQVNGQRSWLAVYTAPRHEKQVLQHLEHRSIECFLPLYESLRRWKSGPTLVSMPLFPGYLFVHADHAERRKVLESPSVIRIVGTRIGPSPLPEAEIRALRQAVSSGLALPHSYLNVGTRVRVMQGPLTGMEGILLRIKGSTRLVLNINLIMQSVSVEVNCCDVEASETSPLAA